MIHKLTLLRYAIHVGALLLIMAGVLVACPIDSYPDEIYTVRDVSAIADGGSATEARQNALLNAEENALQQLLARLANTGGKPIAAQPDDLKRLVLSYELEDEHISTNHYQAIMHITFNPVQVHHFLQEHGIKEPGKAGNSGETSSNNQFFAIPVASLQHWLIVKNRLRDVPGVQSVGVKELMVNQVVTALSYQGNAQSLQAALQQRGFIITPRHGIPLLQAL